MLNGAWCLKWETLHLTLWQHLFCGKCLETLSLSYTSPVNLCTRWVKTVRWTEGWWQSVKHTTAPSSCWMNKKIKKEFDVKELSASTSLICLHKEYQVTLSRNHLFCSFYIVNKKVFTDSIWQSVKTRKAPLRNKSRHFIQQCKTSSGKSCKHINIKNNDIILCFFMLFNYILHLQKITSIYKYVNKQTDSSML